MRWRQRCHASSAMPGAPAALPLQGRSLAGDMPAGDDDSESERADVRPVRCAAPAPPGCGPFVRALRVLVIPCPLLLRQRSCGAGRGRWGTAWPGHMDARWCSARMCSRSRRGPTHGSTLPSEWTSTAGGLGNACLQVTGRLGAASLQPRCKRDQDGPPAAPGLVRCC